MTRTPNVPTSIDEDATRAVFGGEPSCMRCPRPAFTELVLGPTSFGLVCFECLDAVMLALAFAEPEGFAGYRSFLASVHEAR